MATNVLWGTLPLKGVWYMKDNRGVSDTINFGKTGKEVNLVLERDPSNRHDSKAIKVNDMYGCQIGWVPKEQNQHLSMLMDEMGHKFIARVPAGNASAWSSPTMLKMEIFLVKDEYKVPEVSGLISHATTLKQYGFDGDAVRDAEKQLLLEQLRAGRTLSGRASEAAKELAKLTAGESDREEKYREALAKRFGTQDQTPAGDWLIETSVTFKPTPSTKPKMDDFL